MDIIPDAVKDANENAALNGITNAHYETGKAEDVIPRWVDEGFSFDALIVDPPRTGLDDWLIRTILETTPKKIRLYFLQPIDPRS